MITAPQAIILGSIIIAASIIGARVIAPYELASGTAIAWRINVVTGAVELCNFRTEVSDPTVSNPRCR
jgi:hypothetical protein